MKIVYPLPDEPDLTVVGTTADNADQAEAVIAAVGVGNPFYVFETLDPSIEGSPGADFSDAPRVSEDVAETQAVINEMLANPPLDRVFVA
jgi:hypothetical protein